MIIIIFLTLFNFAFATESSPVIDPDKFTICAITINSDDEKKIFQSQVDKYPKKFNPIVELTNMGDDDNWFQKACESKIRCDQLIISGHFAGYFFGENSKKNLPLKDIEKAGCSKTCDGILGQPLEVFLFGCNTLAEKDGDHRTPQQYLQVLLQDGIPLPQAEQIVQSRYGEVGDSNKASMQRAFGGESKQLYGFDSVGPSGKNIKGFLQNYFRKISAPDQLEKLQAKRMLGQLNGANKALAESLKSTAFAECHASELKDEKTKAICKLQDTRASVDEKLDLIVTLMTQKDSMIYFPYINEFFKKNPPQSLSDQQKETLKQLTNNSVIRNQILGMAKKTTGLGFKKELVDFSFNLGYVNKDERAELMRTEVKKIFAKPLTADDIASICNLDYEFSEYVDIKDEDLQNKKIDDFEVYAYQCLSVKDPRVVNRVMNYKFDPQNDDIKSTMIFLAYEANSKEVKLPNDLVLHLENWFKKEDAKEYALVMHTRLLTPTTSSIALAKNFLFKENSDISRQSMAIEHLKAIKIQDQEILKRVNDILIEEKYSQDSLELLIRSESQDPAIQKSIADQLKPNQYYAPMKAIALDYYVNRVPTDKNIQSDILNIAMTESDEKLKNTALNFMKNNLERLDPEVRAKFETIKKE